MKAISAKLVFFLFCSFAFSSVIAAKDIKTEIVEYHGETAHSTLDFKIELPTAGQGFVASRIREKLVEVMDRHLGYLDFSDERKYPAFAGDTDDSKSLADYYSKNALEALRRISEEEKEDYQDDDYSLTYDCSITKVYETERFVVFNSEGFVHSSVMMHASEAGLGPFTFDKREGRLIEHLLKPEPDLYWLRPVLYRGLAEYFREGEEIPTDIDDELMLEDYLIPLPEQNPRPVEYGLVLSYHQYEITIGAAGSPEFVISYHDILPYMSPEAIQVLLGYEDITDALSETAQKLCQYIPDHMIIEDSDRYMTPDFYRAVNEAFSAPDGAYGEIGDNEWLFYFVTGQEGVPYYTVKRVYRIDDNHALADINVQTIIYEISDKPGEPTADHQIEMTRINGKWLLSDFDNAKEKCAEYVEEMRRKYESGEILNYLQSNEFSREYIPDFKKAVEEFYEEFGR